jgi:ATP-dependent Zn protease
MDNKARTVVFWFVLIGVAALLWAVMRTGQNPPKATYSQFLQQVEAGQVNKSVIVDVHNGANPATYTLKDGSKARTMLPWDYRGALEAMQQKMVNIEIQDASSQWIRVLLNAGPFLVLLAFWVWMMNRMRNKQAPR